MNLIDKYLGEAEYPLKYIPKKILKDFENTWNKKNHITATVNLLKSMNVDTSKLDKKIQKEIDNSFDIDSMLKTALNLSIVLKKHNLGKEK